MFLHSSVKHGLLCFGDYVVLGIILFVVWVEFLFGSFLGNLLFRCCVGEGSSLDLVQHGD